MKKVLIEKNKLLIEVEESDLGNKRGCAEWVAMSRLYINDKLYVDIDGVDTFYKIYVWGRNGVVEVTLKYTPENCHDFKKVVLDQFDLKSYVGLKCKKSKSRLFNEWSKEMHENEKSKHFANISLRLFEKYNHLFLNITFETMDRRAKKVKEVTTCEAEKALCDLVLLYTQSYHDKFIISDWYNRVDIVLKNLESAKTNNTPHETRESEFKIVYHDVEDIKELEEEVQEKTKPLDPELKQLEELYELKELMLEQVKNEPVTDETICYLQSIIDEIEPEATLCDNIIIKDEFIDVLNYAIEKQKQKNDVDLENARLQIENPAENKNDGNLEKNTPEIIDTNKQENKKGKRLLLITKDIAISHLKQDFDIFIKKTHTRLREQQDFMLEVLKINNLGFKYAGKKLRRNIEFVKQAVTINENNMLFLEEDLKKDPAFMLELLEYNPELLKFADESLRCNAFIQQQAEGFKKQQQLTRKGALNNFSVISVL